MNNRPGLGRSSRARLALGVAAVLAVAAPLSISGVAAAAEPAVPAVSTASNGGGTAAQWTTRTVAPGVEVRTGTVRNPAATPGWTVTVQAAVTSRFGTPAWAVVGTESWASATVSRLRAAGFEPDTTRVPWPDYADTPRGLMGVRIRVGSYPTQDAAKSTASQVTAAGFRTVVEWTGYDADQPADVENIQVAVIDPRRFTGSVKATHDGNVAQRETTSSVATKLGSLVGVNGGFFLTSDADGVQGVQAGIGAYNGELASMAVGSRAALILGDGGRHNRIADLTTTVTASAGRFDRAVRGVNRTPGLARNCGLPGGLPTAAPRHDTTCTLADDLVTFTAEYAHDLPAGSGVQAVLDSKDRVVSVGVRGGVVAPGHTVLQGIGAAADWLTAHAVVGKKVSVTEVVRDADGRRVRLGANDSIISAAPTLVENGRIRIDAATEGVVDPADLSFGYAWANNRQPRTMAGIDRRGRLLLVTVDGRLSGGSEGFTIAEGAAFMRSLGAEQALNLDGGGSTAMAVNGALVNRPSDATGERAVGDTIQVLPRTR
ncbi:phosphodiester glycosidase family protein [Streptosporangium sp. 'caverna']|uniref:phosphodiester glycosidase family protein n=1 Tax=Streptosporangium sp. 'caverna' TaxID=2202249 RepID=UPI000D7E418C|nr:phosphodiester glycosidase family protein [Streptosporangium sp. 'caverna']AWS45704.1 sporulation protein [Streptosporangium sp. 'caverna']